VKWIEFAQIRTKDSVSVNTVIYHSIEANWHIWEYSIKTHLRETDYEAVDWIELAHIRTQTNVLVTTIISHSIETRDWLIDYQLKSVVSCFLILFHSVLCSAD
jgi:hypothetical protein